MTKRAACKQLNSELCESERTNVSKTRQLGCFSWLLIIAITTKKFCELAFPFEQEFPAPPLQPQPRSSRLLSFRVLQLAVFVALMAVAFAELKQEPGPGEKETHRALAKAQLAVNQKVSQPGVALAASRVVTQANLRTQRSNFNVCVSAQRTTCETSAILLKQHREHLVSFCSTFIQTTDQQANNQNGLKMVTKVNLVGTDTTGERSASFRQSHCDKSAV